MDWALVSRMRCYEHIVRVWRSYGEGMVLIGWVIEVNHQGVAFVCGYDARRV